MTGVPAHRNGNERDGPLARAVRSAVRPERNGRTRGLGRTEEQRLHDALTLLGEVVEACEMEQYHACRDDADGHPVRLSDALRDRVGHALAVTHTAVGDLGRSAVLRAHGAASGARGTIPAVTDALLVLQDMIQARLRGRESTVPAQEVVEAVVGPDESPLPGRSNTSVVAPNRARRAGAIPEEVRILARVLRDEGVMIDGHPVRIVRVHALEDGSRLVLAAGRREWAVSLTRLRRWLDEEVLHLRSEDRGPRPLVAHRALTEAREAIGLDTRLDPHEIDARLTPKVEIRDVASRIAEIAEDEIPAARRRRDCERITALERELEGLLSQRRQRFANYHGPRPAAAAPAAGNTGQLGLDLRSPGA